MKKFGKICAILIIISICFSVIHIILNNKLTFDVEEYVTYEPASYEDIWKKSNREYAVARCRLLKSAVYLELGDYETFSDEFIDFYENECETKDVFLHIKDTFIGKKDFSNEQKRVLLNVLEKIYDGDLKNSEENDFRIRRNLMLQTEILRTMNKPIEALKTKKQLDDYIDDYVKKAKEQINEK